MERARGGGVIQHYVRWKDGTQIWLSVCRPHGTPRWASTPGTPAHFVFLYPYHTVVVAVDSYATVILLPLLLPLLPCPLGCLGRLAPPPLSYFIYYYVPGIVFVCYDILYTIACCLLNAVFCAGLAHPVILTGLRCLRPKKRFDVLTINILGLQFRQLRWVSPIQLPGRSTTLLLLLLLLLFALPV